MKNLWHCKGACGEGGDVIGWVARAEGISDHARARAVKGTTPMSPGPAGEKEYGAEAALRR